MSEQTLQGARILVVEDEYFLADDLSRTLAEAGAEVIGPAASIEDATALIADATRIDVALLDVNLRGDMVYPIADALRARGVPFVFATGYDQWALPERFSDAPRVEKPFKGYKVAAVLGPLVAHGV
jgi:CheY-like chemotaxis protein